MDPRNYSCDGVTICKHKDNCRGCVYDKFISKHLLSLIGRLDEKAIEREFAKLYPQFDHRICSKCLFNKERLQAIKLQCDSCSHEHCPCKAFNCGTEDCEFSYCKLCVRKEDASKYQFTCIQCKVITCYECRNKCARCKGHVCDDCTMSSVRRGTVCKDCL